MSNDLNWFSATKLAGLYAKGKLSPVEVAKASLAHIEKHDPGINAMRLVDEKTTLNQAVESEKRWQKKRPLSALDGVPLLIKDILLVKGWSTLRGSKTVDSRQNWDTDAPSVARMREAGTVFMGMTTTPEFGWKGVTDSPLTGITRNPWNLETTPGGSSGGSSAGLAAGYAPLALGTDGGGSIRIPAAFAGVFGHKPSFGRVPAFPVSPFGTVAHIGPMTRHVRDAALMMNHLAKPDARDWSALPPEEVDYTKGLGTSLKGIRLAYSPKLGFDVEVEPAIAKAVAKAVKLLQRAGAQVEQMDPGFPDPAAMFRVIWWSGVRAAFRHLPEDKLALLDLGLRDVFEQSKEITADELSAANKARAELGSQMRVFMTQYDALITPTMPITAFTAGQLQPGPIDNRGKWVNWTPFTYPFNLTQQPASSVPCGIAPNGLPMGLQIIGRMFDDKTVLRISAVAEGLLGSNELRPKGY